MDLIDKAVGCVKKLQYFSQAYQYYKDSDGGFIPVTLEQVQDVLVSAQDALLCCAAYIQEVRRFNGGKDIRL